MSAFILKIIAIVTMTIDHAGAVVLKDMFFLRMIGRLAFPIFAFLIANGYVYTRDRKKYAVRLFVFALVSQYPFMLAFKSGWDLNIFFTLFLGLIAIGAHEYFMEKNKSLQASLSVLVLAVLATALHTDYGYYGVFLIFLFYYYRERFSILSVSVVILNLVFCTQIAMSYNYYSPRMYVQCLSCLSLIFIYFYNNERGPRLKYFFYAYYPLHLLILAYIEKLKY